MGENWAASSEENWTLFEETKWACIEEKRNEISLFGRERCAIVFECVVIDPFVSEGNEACVSSDITGIGKIKYDSDLILDMSS